MDEAGGVRLRQHLLRLSPAPTKVLSPGRQGLCPPTEMLARVRPLLPRAGVTRLATITGLDRIGIPVVVGIRPNGRILSQAAGKGLTLELAQLSAAMESIELFHAEFAEPPTLFLPYVELAKQHNVVPLAHLPLSRHSLFSPSLPERWTLARNLVQTELVAVPLDLVILPRRGERVRVPEDSLFSFQVTSNGLASGAGFWEALTVGLLEVIERDAVACWVAAAWCGWPMPRVRLDSAADWPLARDVLDQLDRAGVRALVYDCSVDTDVPVYRALLHDAAERRVGLAEGSGAHLDPEIALVRALTEAAQARAVTIAGARDDRFGRDHDRLKLTDSRDRIAALEAQPATVDLHAHSAHAEPTFEQDVQHLLARLKHVGVSQALVVDLTLPEFAHALSVVRVIVPMLDGPGFAHGHPSQRAQAFAARTGLAS